MTTKKVFIIVSGMFFLSSFLIFFGLFSGSCLFDGSDVGFILFCVLGVVFFVKGLQFAHAATLEKFRKSESVERVSSRNEIS